MGNVQGNERTESAAREDNGKNKNKVNSGGLQFNMQTILICIVFVALILLIVRVSQLNEKIKEMDEMMSETLTEDHLTEFSKVINTKLNNNNNSPFVLRKPKSLPPTL